MKIVSHILIVVLLASLYASYCQWQSSKYYMFAAAMEKKQDWPRTINFSIKAAKANPWDDKPLHVLSAGLLRQGSLEAGIALARKSLLVRPYKKYLLNNVQRGVEKLKSLENQE